MDNQCIVLGVCLFFAVFGLARDAEGVHLVALNKIVGQQGQQLYYLILPYVLNI